MIKGADILTDRLESLGLSFMAATLESYLGDPHRRDETLTESLQALIDIEYIARKERSARTRLKLSGIPSMKSLEDFDIGWLKGGLPASKLNELKSGRVDELDKFFCIT
jgi:hypothetical protein